MSAGVTRIFWQKLGLTGPDAVPASLDGRLASVLAEVAQRTAEAWPGVVVAPEAYAAHLAGHVPEEAKTGDAGAAMAAVEALHLVDLALACACACGDEAAVRQFRARIVEPNVRPIAARLGLQAADDLAQQVCERLLLAHSGEPRIAGYSGQGPLAAWTKVAITRAGVNAIRGEKPTASLDEEQTLESATAAVDPDMIFLKSRYGPQFRESFKAALAALSVRDRNLVRFHFIDGMTGIALAAMYGVSRRTIHRWLEDVRAAIMAATRDDMAARLALAPEELESLMRDLQSVLGSTIVKHFRGAVASDGGETAR